MRSDAPFEEHGLKIQKPHPSREYEDDRDEPRQDDHEARREELSAQKNSDDNDQYRRGYSEKGLSKKLAEVVVTCDAIGTSQRKNAYSDQAYQRQRRQKIMQRIIEKNRSKLRNKTLVP